MRKIHRRVRPVETLEQLNKIMTIAAQYTTFSYTKNPYEFKNNCASLRNTTYIQDGQRFLYITTMYVNEKYEYTTEKYACSWKFDKSGQNDCYVEAAAVARASSRIYKPYEEVKCEYSIFDFVKGKVEQSARPLLGYNPKFDKTEHYVYVYDLNSAYASVLNKTIIDTHHWRECDIVGENEVGFMIDSKLTMKTKGQYADRIYKVIDSPFKDYVRKYYEIKRNAPSGSRQKQEAKAMLNYLVGCWQNHNPFLRAYVVNSCNKFIQDIVDKHKDCICMWNTDAIYSTEELKELDVGNDIGQFKLEYQGMFRQKGLVYQEVDINKTCYRGVTIDKRIKDFNILTDEIPTCELKYTFNKDTNTININPKWKGEEYYGDEEEL